jgi:hypothetical protein
MLPLLWEEEKEGQAGSSRGRVVQYGRFLKGQREIAHKTDWDTAFLKGLEGHVEVFDRMDGLQMLSMRGPVSFYQQDDYMGMELLTESPQVQIKSAAFSAASRDPVLRRFATMREYFVNGHREEYPCCLCIRVTLRDTRTGRMAVVWEQDNVPVDQMCSHGNGFDCFADRGTPRDIPIGRLVCPGMAYFGVRRVEDQGEGVSEQDRLYRIDSVREAFSHPSFDVDFTVIGDSDEGVLTLGHMTSALQAVMTPVSMHSGVEPIGS